MNRIEAWACKAISSVDPTFSSLSESEQLNDNLFTSGRLDSMALMNFLVDAESEFGFTFTAESFQDRRIQTICGLAKIINELLELHE